METANGKLRLPMAERLVRQFTRDDDEVERPQTLTYDQTAIRSPVLLFNCLHPDNSCNYTDYYSFTDP